MIFAFLQKFCKFFAKFFILQKICRCPVTLEVTGKNCKNFCAQKFCANFCTCARDKPCSCYFRARKKFLKNARAKIPQKLRPKPQNKAPQEFCPTHVDRLKIIFPISAHIILAHQEIEHALLDAFHMPPIEHGKIKSRQKCPRNELWIYRLVDAWNKLKFKEPTYEGHAHCRIIVSKCFL